MAEDYGMEKLSLDDTKIETRRWLSNMTKEMENLTPDQFRIFLAKYNKKNGCPFNAVIVPSDSDVFIGVENTDESSKTKRPITSPQALRKKMKYTATKVDCLL